MRISVNYIYTKLEIEYAHLRLHLAAANPYIVDMAILTASSEFRNDLLYFHTGPGVLRAFPGISIVVPESASHLYSGCSMIIIPDSVDIGDVFNSVASVIREFRAWYESVSASIMSNGSLQDILQISTSIINAPMYFADAGFKMLAQVTLEMSEVSVIWRYQLKYGYLPFHVVDALNKTEELKLLNTTPHAFYNHTKSFVFNFISKSIKSNGQIMGYFFILDLYKKLNNCDIEIAECLGKLISKASINNQSYLTISNAYHRHFMIDIIKQTLKDPTVISHRLKPLGWTMEGSYYLLIVSSANDSETMRMHMISVLTDGQNAQAFVLDGMVIVVFNTQNRSYESLYYHLLKHSDEFERCVALSERFLWMDSIHHYYEQALFLVEHHERLFRGRNLMTYDMYSVDHFIQLVKGKSTPHIAAQILYRHDKKNNTDYCLTLHTYICCERNAAKTAQSLFLHRNTLKYRLERISELVDIDLNDYIVRVRMTYSLYAYIHGIATESETL